MQQLMLNAVQHGKHFTCRRHEIKINKNAGLKINPVGDDNRKWWCLDTFLPKISGGEQRSRSTCTPMLCFEVEVEGARIVSAVLWRALGSAVNASGASADAPQRPSNSLINSEVAAFTSAPSTDSTWACRFPSAADIPTGFQCPVSRVSPTKTMRNALLGLIRRCVCKTAATWLSERRGVSGGGACAVGCATSRGGHQRT